MVNDKHRLIGSTASPARMERSAFIRGIRVQQFKEPSVVVNGESRAYRSGLTLLTLLEELKVDARAAAVMVGEDVYRPGRVPDVALSEGDVIEIVSMMQGG